MSVIKTLNENLGRLNKNDFLNTPKIPLIIVLDNIRSMNNVGSVFRTADAFLIESIYLCGITPCPPHREINKTALGATETVHWIFEENILDLLAGFKKKQYQIFAIEQTNQSQKLHDFEFDQNAKYVFVFGNEMDGVQPECFNYVNGCIEISQYGTKHSLNVAVCAGICMWEFSKKKSQLL